MRKLRYLGLINGLFSTHIMVVTVSSKHFSYLIDTEHKPASKIRWPTSDTPASLDSRRSSGRNITCPMSSLHGKLLNKQRCKCNRPGGRGVYICASRNEKVCR